MLGAPAGPRPPGTLAALVPVGPPVPVCGVGAGQRVIRTVTRKVRFPAVSHNCPFSTQYDFSGKKANIHWLTLFSLFLNIPSFYSQYRLTVGADWEVEVLHLGSQREARWAQGGQAERLSEMKRGCHQAWTPDFCLLCGQPHCTIALETNCPSRSIARTMKNTMQSQVSLQLVFVELYA